MPVTKRCFALSLAVEAVFEESFSDDDDNVSIPDICILPPNDGADYEVEAVDEDILGPD